MSKPRCRSLLWVLTLTAACFSPSASAQESLETLARELVAMRGEVEQLQSRLDELQQAQRARRLALAGQRAELEGKLRQARLQEKQLRRSLEEQREAIRRAQSEDQALAPLLHRLIERQRQRVQSGLPFKTQERLALLDEIQTELEHGVISAAQAATRLWAFIEDEARLARESGLYRQPVDIGGEIVLAEVARLGLIALFYRSPEGRVGYLQRDENAWRARPITDPEAGRQVDELFEALARQVHSGFFLLPNALEVTP